VDVLKDDVLGEKNMFQKSFSEVELYAQEIGDKACCKPTKIMTSYSPPYSLPKKILNLSFSYSVFVIKLVILFVFVELVAYLAADCS
jgi:hypothetical protein